MLYAVALFFAVRYADVQLHIYVKRVDDWTQGAAVLTIIFGALAVIVGLVAYGWWLGQGKNDRRS